MDSEHPRAKRRRKTAAELDAGRPAWWQALMRLSARYRPADVAARLGTHGGTVEKWITREMTPTEDQMDALVSLEQIESANEHDDAMVFAVQALREIERESALDGQSITIQELVGRVGRMAEMSQRALAYLQNKF